MPKHTHSISTSAVRLALLGAATLATASAVTGASAAPAARMVARAGNATTHSRTALHQEVFFAASPQRVYAALLSSDAFAKFTGMPARIDPHVGGAISMFGGLIAGRNLELVPGKRIVQAWRPVQDFPSGVYSVVKMDLVPKGSGTTLILDHTGFPEGHFDHLNQGWPPRYWNPLKKYLASAQARK